jgi:hypothetical protein
MKSVSLASSAPPVIPSSTLALASVVRSWVDDGVMIVSSESILLMIRLIC